MSEFIGLWMCRLRNDTRLGKWHLVESTIRDHMVMRCGRQMGHIDGTVLAPLMAPPTSTDACHFCKGAA
jgi:hypothetical protein